MSSRKRWVRGLKGAARLLGPLGPVAVTSLSLFLAACQRAPLEPNDDGPTIDARGYAHGFCSLKCYRLAECGLDEASTPSCADECVDEAVNALPLDPCWAEWIELRRCSVLNASCDGIADEMLPAGSETICERREQGLGACEM